MTKNEIPQWKDLPFLVKDMIVRRATESTRNALRACSTQDKLLVERTRQKHLDYVYIGKERRQGTFVLKVRQEKLGPPFYAEDEDRKFESFEELQEGVIDLLRRTDSIKTLRIDHIANKPALKMSTNRRTRVEFLTIREENGKTIEKLLSHFEPVYLRKVFLLVDGGNSRIYDLPQIIFTEALEVEQPSCIREDQLLELHSKAVLFHIKCSVRKYVKKCIEDAGTKFHRFRFYGQGSYNELKTAYSWFSKKALIKTWNPRIKLQLKFRIFYDSYEVDACTLYDSASTAFSFYQLETCMLRKIEDLQIRFVMYEGWEIEALYEPFKVPITLRYGRKQFAKFQKHLDEILKNVDVISSLIIHIQDSPEKIKWRLREKKLIVLKLSIRGDSSKTSFPELLEQVNPVFMRSAKIESIKEEDAVFDFPHVQNAVVVTVGSSFLRDDQLIKINAEFFTNKDDFDGASEQRLKNSLTAGGINRYIKRCLAKLDEKRYMFLIYNVLQNLNRDEILEGFEVLLSSNNDKGKIVLLKSLHMKYVLRVQIHPDGHLEGVREERSTYTKYIS